MVWRGVVFEIYLAEVVHYSRFLLNICRYGPSCRRRSGTFVYELRSALRRLSDSNLYAPLASKLVRVIGLLLLWKVPLENLSSDNLLELFAAMIFARWPLF